MLSISLPSGLDPPVARAGQTRAFRGGATASHGYLQTVRQHERGGYETWLGTNTLEVHTVPRIVESLLAMLQALHVPAAEAGQP